MNARNPYKDLSISSRRQSLNLSDFISGVSEILLIQCQKLISKKPISYRPASSEDIPFQYLLDEDGKTTFKQTSSIERSFRVH